MVLTFTPVIGGSAPFLGPGYGFTAKSTIGAVPGHVYELDVQVRDSTTGQTACQIDNVNYVPGDNWDAIFNVEKGPNDVVSQGAAGGVYGNSAIVEVELFDVTAQVVADGPQTFQGYFHDPIGNLALCFLNKNQGSASGNFTAADRAQLQAITHQVVLPSYSSILTHTGLTGDGSLNTQAGVRALRVTVTTFPPGVLRDPGTPEYFFNLGFVTLNVQQGWVRSARLVFEFQQYEAPAALDSFGWTLRNGTTINVEELVPTQPPPGP